LRQAWLLYTQPPCIVLHAPESYAERPLMFLQALFE